MSPRRIKGEKMLYWGFYISPAEKANTIKCAESANESDSEYIRKAVEMRNNIEITKAVKQGCNDTISSGKIDGVKPYKPTIESVVDTAIKKIDIATEVAKKPTVQELKETVKKIEGKDYFRPCPKGGK